MKLLAAQPMGDGSGWRSAIDVTNVASAETVTLTVALSDRSCSELPLSPMPPTAAAAPRTQEDSIASANSIIVGLAAASPRAAARPAQQHASEFQGVEMIFLGQ